MHKFDAHRLMGLIVRYPKHKWKFKVWQMMWLKMHTDSCDECQTKMDKLLNDKPQIGFNPEKN